ncbi:hypothetical protein AB6A40_008060 [Gnathostoma spinigerum]|uniref:AP-3 complex subunit delta Mu C-terminal domain-containing protein n=1 Tax=Gnathostoma spinigerum TaxID=75299 RepID=A0ABD6ENH5_9BILA
MNSVYRALDINLDEPLREEEAIAVQGPQPYSQPRVTLKEQPKHLIADDEKLYNCSVYNGPLSSDGIYASLSTKDNIESKKTRSTKKSRDGKSQTHGKTRRLKSRTKRNTDASNEKTELMIEQDVANEWSNSLVSNKAANKALDISVPKSSKKLEKRAKETRRKQHELTLDEPHDKDVYEVTSGVCTPSNPYILPDSSVNGGSSPQEEAVPLRGHKAQVHAKRVKLNSYKLLGENADLRMTYETRVSTDEANQVAVAIAFENKTRDNLRQLELNILDTLNIRLLRSQGLSSMAPIPLDFQLSGGMSNEQVLRFSVKAINVSQKLRGTLTYFHDAENGSTQDKIDFHIMFPTLSFTVFATIGSDAYSLLLESDDIAFKSSVKFITALPWRDVLKKACFYGHLSVVEQEDESASLYTHTIHADPICILIKKKNENVSIEAKSCDNGLVCAIVEGLRDVVLQD